MRTNAATALEMVRCILETLQVTTDSSDTCTTLDCGKPRSESQIQDALLGLDDPSAEADLRGNWFTVEGSYADASGNGYDGTSNITFFVDECPQEDLDGDGVATWEDCDDGDANLPNSDDQDCDGILASAGDCDDLNALVGMNITGVSTDCAALSCNEVSSMGYSTGMVSIG